MKNGTWIMMAFALIATQQWVSTQVGGIGGLPTTGTGTTTPGAGGTNTVGMERSRANATP